MPIGTTNYPASIDTATTLVQVTNNAVTTVGTGGCTSTDVTIPITDTSLFPGDGALTIITGGVPEIVTYTGKTATSITGVTRHVDGSAAAAHFAGDAVELRSIALHHAAQNAALIAIQNKLGPAASTPAARQFLKAVANAGTGAVTTQWVKDPVFNLLDFYPAGFTSYGNSASHPLSTWYGSLAAAQVDYPQAGALTDEVDGTAIQKGITTAIAGDGKLWIPAPVGDYLVNRRITIDPVTPGGFAHVNIEMEGSTNNITWTGADGTGTAPMSVFRSKNWKSCRIVGVRISLNTANNMAGWDLDADATNNSSGFLVFSHCSVSFGSGLSNVGWRGNVSAGDRDLSYVLWEACQAAGPLNTAATAGHIGWQNLTTNGLVWLLVNCGVLDTYHIFANTLPDDWLVGAIASTTSTTPITVHSTARFPTVGQFTVGTEDIGYTGVTATTFTGISRAQNGTTGATHSNLDYVQQKQVNNAQQGGGTMYFIDCGSTRAACDFSFDTAGQYGVYGGRYEVGKRFMRVSVGQTPSSQVTVQAAQISTYTPTDEVLFALGGAVNLNLLGCNFVGHDHTAAFISCGNFDNTGNPGGGGAILVIGGAIRSLVDPVYSNLPTTWDAQFIGVQRLNSANQAIAFFNPNRGFETDVDFGSVPVGPQRFTVTNPRINAGSRILIGQSGNTPTGGFGDEAEWDPILFSAKPAAGSMVVAARPLDGVVLGKFKIAYELL